MSDPSCDPNLDVCDETAFDSFQPEEKTSKFALDRNEVIFGVGSLLMMVEGFQYYSWYPSAIKGDNGLYPDRDYDPSTPQSDEVWALSTKEISAWTTTSYVNMAFYGFGFLTWGLNLAFDNKAGAIH